MQLGELLGAFAPFTTDGAVHGEVGGIAYDSRQVRPGDVFVAQPGRRFDGSAFVAEAVQRGAVAVVSENPHPPAELRVPYIQVASASLALSRLSAAFHGFPARRLGVVGVTGTDGKTTTVHILSTIIAQAGIGVGRVSTVDLSIGGTALPNQSDHTTPQAPDIQHALARMLASGARYAIVETSSHSLVRNRVADCEFDVAVITNLSPEHLDFHGDFARYRDDKARLFRMLAESCAKGIPKFGVVNADDAEAGYFRAACPAPVVSYGLDSQADVMATEVRDLPSGTEVLVHASEGDFSLETRLIGRFNVQNWLAATATALRLGIPQEAIVSAAARLEAVPGRLQVVEGRGGFGVVVDFAHTPNALAAVLQTLRGRTSGRLLVVFGLPGGRDPANRPRMAEAAARYADFFIITTDDPYDEDPAAISAQIEAGAEALGLKRGVAYEVIPDRREAIALAIAVAKPGDTVLIAGRGHERFMSVADQKLPFDDAEVAREILGGRPG